MSHFRNQRPATPSAEPEARLYLRRTLQTAMMTFSRHHDHPTQGCGVGVETGAQVVLTGAGVGARVGKIWPTPTPARSRRLTPSRLDDGFGRTVVHGIESIARQEERENGSA